MNKNELLEKIKRQCGYIDFIDALCLISIYTDEFGILKTQMKPEDELILMYMKLKGHKVKLKGSRKIDPENLDIKTCDKCKIEKSHSQYKPFYYKGEKKRNSTCYDCVKRIDDFGKNWKKSIDDKISKFINR